MRQIFEEGEGEGGEPPVIHQEVLVRHALGAAPSATRRLSWHPQLDSLLAVAAKDRVCLVNVPPTLGVAASPEFASPAVPAAPATEGAITALAFCDRGDMLAVADDKGYVYVWGLGREVVDGWASGAALEPLAAEPDVKFHAFEGNGFVSTLDFLPSKSKQQQQKVCWRLCDLIIPAHTRPTAQFFLCLVCNCLRFLLLFSDALLSPPSCVCFFPAWLSLLTSCAPALPHVRLQAVLVVGDATCRVLKLWSIDIESKPRCCHTLELVSGRAGPDAFFNHMVLQPGFGAIVLANTKGKQVYVLHAKQYDDDDGSGARFDYVSDFAVTQPILSLTTTTEPCFEDGSEVFQLFTVQTEGIQQYTLFPEVCLPIAEEAETEAEAAAGAARAESPPLLTPAEVMQHVDNNNNKKQPKPRQAPVEAAVVPSPVPAAAEAETADAASDTASDAASPFRPQGTDGAEAAAPAAVVVAVAASAGPSCHPLPDRATGTSEHGSSGSPPASTTAFATAEAMAPVSAAATREHPMPPQPTMLVQKLSVSGTTQLVPLEASAVTAAAAAAPPREKADEVDAGSEESDGGEEEEASRLVPEQQVGAAAAGTLAATSGAGGSSSDMARMLALQEQLLSQLASSQVQTAKLVRQELAKAAKASEAATARAVDAALKAHAKAAEGERAREAKKEREETAKQLQLAVASIVKDLGGKVTDASRATVAAVGNSLAASVTRAVGEALPAALGSGATQTALEKALGGQLRGALPKAVSDAFAAAVIPAFERAAAAMFGQIEATFASGLAEHLAASRASSELLGVSLQQAAAQVSDAAKQLAAAAGEAGAGGGGGGGERAGAISLAELEARKDPKHVIAGEPAPRCPPPALVCRCRILLPSILQAGAGAVAAPLFYCPRS